MHNDYQVEIRFADIDVMGHVNNAVYLSYFEQARISFFNELVGKDWDWYELGILLARNEIDYKQPVLMSDHVIIRTRCEHVGNTSLVFAYDIYRTPKGQTEATIAAQGKSVLVCFDYKKQQKIEVPAEWKERLA
ncbi:acyl-CoA thioesterase [Sanyastnella coralliicola]|uniref:acyl-CoA thioesterase n=1 Tax=Sanyastnella coralliicola TaxID=3069118 RepID=UPI0027B8C039|nr:thioesterase family protein [Longitalea sp. SCSIO 12813]